MIQYRTKPTGSAGQKQIVLSLDERSDLDPGWLLGYFQEAISRGERFTANQTVQVAWMTVMLKESRPDELEVVEPQFDSIPVKWIPGVNNTLRHLVLQKSVAELFSAEPSFPSMRQAAIVSKEFLTTPTEADFRMVREAATGNDSGWRLDVASPQERDVEHRSLFELSFHEPTIVPFLALPVGAVVLNRQGRFALHLGAASITSEESKFLNELSQSRVWV